MQITWLGQAGLLFELSGKKILIDPYLSNSVAKIEPQNYRRVPVDERFLKIKPDMIVITHNHADHLDKETLCHYLNKDSSVTVLAPSGAWQELRNFGGLKNNYVLFDNGTTWTEDFAQFRAVKAEHSDKNAIGVILTVNGKHYYVTGDTLYNEKVFDSLPSVDYEMLFLPVNGVGNNMNFHDAKRFAQRIGAKYVIPIHFGMFDEIRLQSFAMQNMIIPTIYQEILFS